VEDLPVIFHPQRKDPVSLSLTEIFQIKDLKEAQIAFEREFIRHKLQENNHDIDNTAKNIGINIDYLEKRLEKL
jgi:transcriptional regulator with PAS, ATPase and Fis domain